MPVTLMPVLCHKLPRPVDAVGARVRLSLRGALHDRRTLAPHPPRPPCVLQYRARQKRLVANSSRMPSDRSRLQRDVEEALRRWAPGASACAPAVQACLARSWPDACI